MKILPKFRKNMRWSQVNLVHLQNLVDEVKKLQNIKAGHGLRVTSRPDGILFSLDSSVSTGQKSGLSTVVLIEEPTDDSTSLKVREVKLRTSFPNEGPELSPYEWAPTDVIDAVPDFGYEIPDYAGFLWDLEEDPEPTSDTVFLRLQRNYKQRNILWYPSGGDFRFAVVRSVDEGVDPEHPLTDYSVLAEAVRWTGTEWTFVGEATEIATYPGVHRKFYEPFVFQGVSVSFPNTPILRIFSADGEIWLEQTIRWSTRKSPGNISLSDCTPHERVTDE